nr:hypothetical protein [Tanacetum cinerariifolium]
CKLFSRGNSSTQHTNSALAVAKYTSTSLGYRPEKALVLLWIHCEDIPLLEAYVSKPEAPLLPVHAPVYPKYLAPSDDDIAPTEDQPLPASPIALSPGYIADYDPIEDGPEEDPKMDHVDYAAEEEQEESSKEEEEEHLAPTDSTLYVLNSVPSADETAQISVRPHTPPSPFTKARIFEYAFAPTPPSLSPYPLSPLSSPLPLIPSTPLLLPSHTHWVALARGVDYGFIDTLDVRIRATNERVMTTLEEVNERITDLTTTHRYDGKEVYTHHSDAQDDQALLQTRISTLERERRYFYSMSFSFKREARYARQTWAHSKDRSQTIKAQIRVLHAEVRVLQRQRIDNERTRDAERQDGLATAGSDC